MMRQQTGLLDEPIGTLELSVRTANALDGEGIFTVRDLLNSCPKRESQCLRCCACFRELSPDQHVRYLLDIPNFGDKTLAEVYLALEAVGFARSSREFAAEQERRQQLAKLKQQKRKRRFRDI